MTTLCSLLPPQPLGARRRARRPAWWLAAGLCLAAAARAQPAPELRRAPVPDATKADLPASPAALTAGVPTATRVEPSERVITFCTNVRHTPAGAAPREFDEGAFDQELSAIVAKAAGLSYRIVEFSSPLEALAGLERGTVDVLPSYARVPERANRFLFSVRHSVTTAAIFVRRGARAPATPSDVARLRLAAARNSSAESYIRRKGWQDRAVFLPTTVAALTAVRDGEVDGCLSNQLVALSALRRLGLTEAIVPAFPLADSSVDVCMVVRMDDGGLLARLNDGLLLASERGDLQRLREKWLPLFNPDALPRSRVLRWLAIGSAGMVMVVGLGWLWYVARLQHERRQNEHIAKLVAARTQELADAVAHLRASEEAVQRLNAELEGRVTERTTELARRVAEVERLNRELESFSYSVSHDLRAPLRNISGFLELLTRRVAGRLDAEETRYIDTVTRETVRMGTLIDSLLAFAKVGRVELKCEQVALAGLLNEVRLELEPSLGQRAVEWRVGALPTVVGDRVLLRQVVANLLDNAVKFTRQRQPAIIEVGTPATPDETGMVTVFVRDNGAGFNPAYAGKLFGVFQRLHNQRDFEGTGIGLASVKRIIERHGGRVWAEGTIGHGATFSFSLPAVCTEDLIAAARSSAPSTKLDSQTQP